ncbi:MAG TPA: ATP-binding protein [Rectinemataceae bacterium]|nr:ATP-binding protein [Rectinemataceae bacterium]
MKVFLLSLALTLLMLSPTYSSEPIPLPSALRVGVYDNPPKIGLSSEGKSYGFHIDLLEAILEGSGISPEYIPGTWEEGLGRLARGEIDVMPDVAYSAARADSFDFNNESALLNWAVVYAATASSIATITDLNGKTVAVMRDSIHTTGEHGIVTMAADYGVECEFLFLDSYEDCFKAIADGRASAAVVNRLFGLMNETDGGMYRTTIIFNPSQIRYAFRKGAPVNAGIIALFDRQLKSLRGNKDSAYYRAFERHLTPQISKEKKHPGWINTMLLLAIALSIVALLLLSSAKMPKKDHRQLRRFFEEYQSMGDIRASIVDSTLISYSLFSIPLLLSVAYHVATIGFDVFVWVYTPLLILPCLVALGRKRIAVETKITLLLFFLFSTGTIVLAARSNIGIGFSYFFSAGIIATILYGRQAGINALAAGLVIAVAFGILVSQELLRIDLSFTSYFTAPSSWVFTIITFFMMFFTIISGLQKFYGSLMDAVENLERRIAERTEYIDTINKNLQVEIHEHKKSEEMLEIARAEAERANGAKTIFFSGMSHEIRTPLNAILGYSQILMRDKGLSGESLREIETINASGEHLLTLINEVLEMSKIESGKIEASIEPCDVRAVLLELKKMFAMSASKKGIEFSVGVPADIPPYILTDEAKLKQILINLIGNAIKFTDIGSVSVDVSVIAEPPSRLAFKVSDTGSGVAAEDIQKIFRPFEQTDVGRSKGGTGLGLSISQKYCQLLGGELNIQSERGAGTSFSFSIDAPPHVAEGAIEEGETRIDGILKGIPPRILVVDDRETNRDILVKLLEPLGFPTAQAANGAEALELIDSWNPGIILLDLVMPGISGKDLIRIIRTDPAKDHIKIIVITASVLDKESDDVLGIGANAFIRKPFREKVVLEAIGRLAHLGYRYVDKDGESGRGQDEEAVLAARFAVLPAELSLALSDSIKSGDLEEVKALADAIMAIDDVLAKGVRKMAENFQIKRLMEIANLIS